MPTIQTTTSSINLLHTTHPSNASKWTMLSAELLLPRYPLTTPPNTSWIPCTKPQMACTEGAGICHPRSTITPTTDIEWSERGSEEAALPRVVGEAFLHEDGRDQCPPPATASITVASQQCKVLRVGAPHPTMAEPYHTRQSANT